MVASQVELATKIDDFVHRLRSAVRVELVILYGSHARGKANEWSDIDIAVVSPEFEGKSAFEVQEIIARSTVGRAYRISPIGYPSSEYHNPRRHPFLGEIIRTGRVVYEARRD
jgi:predicted nucleotidyltransferase